MEVIFMKLKIDFVFSIESTCGIDSNIIFYLRLNGDKTPKKMYYANDSYADGHRSVYIGSYGKRTEKARKYQDYTYYNQREVIEKLIEEMENYKNERMEKSIDIVIKHLKSYRMELLFKN
jgi:hypothetical protein